MIKAVINKGERRVLFLGLSAQNLKMLRKRKPILIVGEEMGLPGVDLLIQGGETEQTIAAELMRKVNDAPDPADQH